MKTKKIIVFVIAMALLLSGCQAAKPAALTNDQVIQEVDHFLRATQSGDYQKAVENFSSQMMAAYSEAQFDQLRDLLQRASGNYVYCSNEKLSLSNSQGYAIYHLTCKFEREDVAVTITYKVDGTQVEGLYFSSVNLVKQSK